MRLLAAQLTNYLIPQDYLLFTQSMRPEKYPISKNHNAKLRMKKAFWGKALSISQNAFALLTVAELLSSNDGRNRELAEMINDQYLHLTKLPLIRCCIALSNVVAAANSIPLDYFIAGATARDIVLHGIFGYAPSRATRDIDTAIFIRSWDEFTHARNAPDRKRDAWDNTCTPFNRTKTGLPLDIIPLVR